MATLEAAAPYDRLLGVGLDRSEASFPPKAWWMSWRPQGAPSLQRVAHTGEEGAPTYITDALESHAAKRIDHGFRCDEDARLTR